jgi:hypothetical protein
MLHTPTTSESQDAKANGDPRSAAKPAAKRLVAFADGRQRLNPGQGFSPANSLVYAHAIYGNQAVLRALNNSSAAAPGLQRKCGCGDSGDSCRECESKEAALHRTAANQTAPEEVPPIVHEVLRSPGDPLDANTRAFMEPRLGPHFSHAQNHAQRSVVLPARLSISAPHDEFEQEADKIAHHAMSHSAAHGGTRPDFSEVRIHTDSRAAKSAQAVSAHAYTVGNHIVFGTGKFAPQTDTGGRLLAHELTHVLQQTNGRVQRASFEPAPDDEDQTANGILQRDFAIEPPHPNAEGRVLTAAEMQAAIDYNQQVVAVIGADGIRELRDVLGVSEDPAVIDEDFVRAVVDWQAMNGRTQDGRLGPRTAGPLFREIGAEAVGRGQLVSGPTYHATTALTPPVVGGLQQGGHRFEAEFVEDPANGVFASCCEVRQSIQWDAAYAAAAPTGPPHGGFGATPADRWIEDRNDTDTIRYGHRFDGFSGSLGAGNEYIDNTGQRNAAFGNVYRGRDFPGTHRIHAGHWRFHVHVRDTCNSNALLGEDYLRYTW